MSDAKPAVCAELKVTNDGADSATCGQNASPCRSISQAIENASDGDTIEVGAGRYGSISGSTNFSGPGDEHPSMPPYTYGCIICITKALHIASIHGAAVTVIEGSPSGSFTSNVMILSDGVVFGDVGHGFTITGGNVYGLTIFESRASARNISIAGNIDMNDGTGFFLSGRTFSQIQGCPPAQCILAAQILLSDNEAIGNGTGFNFTVNLDQGPGPIIVRNNVSIGAGTGFAAFPGCAECMQAQDAPASDVQFVDNVAAHGGVGFATGLSGPIVGNTASDNSQAGFLVTPGGSQVFRSNSAIGNAGPGVIVNFSPDAFDLQYGAFSIFDQNNIYGNDRNRPMLSSLAIGIPLSGFNPGPGAHCGILNVGALAALTPGVGLPPAPTIYLEAGGNFWGSASGPQPNGPGDTVGGVCDQNGGVTVAKPAAAVAFEITSWP